MYIYKKMKISIKDFFMRIWSHLLKKSLMEKFIFCAVLNDPYNKLCISSS